MTDDEDESIAGRAWRAHIHKMHTYRDALDRVASVRVLYPGSTEDWYPAGPHGARQGVGSSPLRVGNAADSSALRSLLKELIPSAAIAAGDALPPSGADAVDRVNLVARAALALAHAAVPYKFRSMPGLVDDEVIEGAVVLLAGEPRRAGGARTTWHVPTW